MKSVLAAILIVVGGAGFLSSSLSCAEKNLFVPDAGAQKWAEGVLAKMPLEKKVAQLIFVDVTGGYIAADAPRLEKWIQQVRDLGVGGVVFYGGSPRDVAWLLNRLQKEAAIPVLMASDFEGGPGQQITGATEFPGDMALAAIGSEELVYRVAQVGAVEGRALGIHLTYSPVVDISTQPENPAESVRTFGSDVNLLGRLVKAYVRGYMENGMLTTAKHFPGRGNVSDSPAHPGFSTIKKTAASLQSEEMMAFKKAIEAGVPFIMTEHISAPAITGGSDLPASVEKKLATGWIRDKLGFRGLLTSDDLWYDHVTERFGVVQVGVKALAAGHDLLLKPKDPAAMIQGVVAAVRAGEITEAHIDQAASKLLYWKARLGLPENRFVDESKVNTLVGSKEHWRVAQEVADRSLTLLENDGLLPLAPEKLKNIVNISVQKLESDPSPALLGAKLRTAFPGVQDFTLRPGMDPAAYDPIFEAGRAADLVILSFFVQRDRMRDAAPLRPGDLALIERMIAAKPGKVIAMSYGNPHLIRKLPNVPAFVVGYGERGWFGNQSIYFDSFIGLLRGEIKPQGTLPVMVSEKYPVGRGLKY